MTTSPSPSASSLSNSNGVSGSSLPPFRSFLRMLNWRRDPAAEQRRMQLEKEIALLDWMHFELDLIEADLPSNSTPPQATAANSSGC